MNDYLNCLKNKYNYDNQMIDLLSRIINAFINVLGEEYTDLILSSIEKVIFINYEDNRDATNKTNQIINDGNNHPISPCANGCGFTEDYYNISNDQINQNFVVGFSNSSNKIAVVVHELCHVISSFGKVKKEDDKLVSHVGFNEVKRDISNGKVGKIISSTGVVFNEIVTENLSMQIMDYLEPEVKHEPNAYNGYVNVFKGIFRNDRINKTIIDNYFNDSYSFLSVIESVISKEEKDNAIDEICNNYDLNSENINNYLKYIKSLSVKEFFLVYINYINYFLKTPEGIDKDSFKEMKNINSQIIINLSNSINEKFSM